MSRVKMSKKSVSLRREASAKKVTRRWTERAVSPNGTILDSRAGDLPRLRDYLARRAATKNSAIAHAAGESLSAETVGVRLRLSGAAIRDAINGGRLLAYRHPGKRTFVFPAFQFEGTTVAPWIPEVVASVGNGFAALHFLTVARKSLANDSFLTRLAASATTVERNARIADLLAAARALTP